MAGMSLIAEYRVVVGNTSKTLAELIGHDLPDKVEVMETKPDANGIFESMRPTASASDFPVEMSRGRFGINAHVGRLHYYAASDIAMTVRFFAFQSRADCGEGV